MPYTNLEIIPMVLAFIIPPFPDFYQINLIKYTNLYKTYVRSLRFWKILSKQPNTQISVEYYLYVLLHPSNIIWAGTTRLLFLSYLLIYELWLTIEENMYFLTRLVFPKPEFDTNRFKTKQFNNKNVGLRKSTT